MMFNIITPDQRKEERSVKGVIFGPHGIGKTSLLWTLNPKTTLFVNFESGGLSVQKWEGYEIKVRDWQTALNIACLIGGADQSKGENATFSQAHYNWVKSEAEKTGFDIDKFETIFFDSITDATRHALAWSKIQPQSFSEKTGKPDTRGAYGLLGQEVISWARHLQHSFGKNIWLVGGLDKKLDDFNRPYFEPQLEGSKIALELPGIMDQVITMAELFTSDGKPYRAFVCSKLNTFGFPAKDRSGTLDEIEPPHLGRLMEKILAGKRKPIAEYTYTIQE